MLNLELVEELHKSIIRKFKKRKVHLSLFDNICGTDQAEMSLISKISKRFRFHVMCYWYFW